MDDVHSYIRVSSKDQNEDRQVEEMIKQGVSFKNIVIEKQSGSTFNRSKYLKLKRKLKTGSTLFIHELDRLGRTYSGIIKEYEYYRGKGIYLKVLNASLLDTDRENLSLMDIFIQDIVLRILAYFAEQEFHFNKKRQKEGIAIAKAKGIRFGPERHKPTDKELQIVASFRMGNLTPIEAMNLLGRKKTAFYKFLKRIADTEN